MQVRVCTAACGHYVCAAHWDVSKGGSSCKCPCCVTENQWGEGSLTGGNEVSVPEPLSSPKDATCCSPGCKAEPKCVRKCTASGCQHYACSMHGAVAFQRDSYHCLCCWEDQWDPEQPCKSKPFVLNMIGTHPEAVANRRSFAGRPDRLGEERTGTEIHVNPVRKEPSSTLDNMFWCACACRCGNVVSNPGDECSLCKEHDVHNGEVWLKAAYVGKVWPRQSGWDA